MGLVFGKEELEYLRQKDEKLAYLIDHVSLHEYKSDDTVFESLVHQIVAQQISLKAQITIWKRIQDTLGEVTPEKLHNLTDDEIQTFGLSFRKVKYIRSLTNNVLDGNISFDHYNELSDEEIIEDLIRLEGIGKWTAEMIMIFCLGRKNILSYGDLAIRNGLCLLYRHREITPKLYKKYRNKFHPYNSIASLYIWHIAVNGIPE